MCHKQEKSPQQNLENVSLPVANFLLSAKTTLGTVKITALMLYCCIILCMSSMMFAVQQGQCTLFLQNCYIAVLNYVFNDFTWATTLCFFRIGVFPCSSKYNHPVVAHFLGLDHSFSEIIKSTIKGFFFFFLLGCPFMIYLYDKVAQGKTSLK